MQQISNITKVILGIVCLALLTAITGCGKVAKDPIEYIRYKVNGKAYEMKYEFSMTNDNIKTYFWPNDGFLIDWMDNDEQSFSVYFQIVPNYPLKRNYTEATGGGGDYKTNYGSTEYFWSIKCTSSITEIKDRYYTGTFEYIAVGEYSGDTVHITDGTFRVYLDE